MTAEDDKVEVEVEVEEGTSGSGKAASRIACPGYCVCCQPTCGIPIAFDSISHSLQSALPFNFKRLRPPPPSCDDYLPPTRRQSAVLTDKRMPHVSNAR